MKKESRTAGSTRGHESWNSSQPSGERNQKVQETDPFIYVPEGFDPAKYGGVIARHPDAARWLLSTIYMRRINRNYDREHFSNLHSKLLGFVMGDINHVRPIREAMETHGLIACDHEWAEGSKSLGYKIGPALEGVTFRHFYSTHKRFTKRVRKFKDMMFVDEVGCPVREHLKHWCKKVTFSDRLEEVIDSLPETPYKGNLFPNKRVLAQHQVDMIRNFPLDFTSQDRYGRFHSNFSSLIGELRRCLLVDGESLHEVDVVNSQPYLLSMLILESYLSGGFSGVNLPNLVFSSQEDHSLFIPPLNPTDLDFSQVLQGASPVPAPYVSGLRILESLPIPPDLLDMVKRSSEGQFYEAFQGNQHDMTRDEVKKTLFTVLFGQERLMWVTEVGKLFQETFPTAFDQIIRLKDNRGYKFIGQELQRRESSIVINTVCRSLHDHHRDVPVLTVHDSILTPQSHLETVMGLLVNAFQRCVLPPRFKIKEPAR